jgi:hypothetical protein
MLQAGNQQAKPSIWSHEPNLTPEKKIWRAVLTQAFEDAEATANGDADGSETFACMQARQYLRADSPQEAGHLKLVCEYAEIPADRVMLWARQRYRAEASIEELGECSGADTAIPTERFAGPEMQEPCLRTDKNCIAVQAVATEAPSGPSD